MRFISLLRPHARLHSQVDAYVDGELNPAASARFESHLSECRSCVEAVALGREIKVAFATVPPVEAPRSFHLTPAMIQQPVRASLPPPRGQFALRLAQTTAGVAIVGLAAVAAYDLSSSDSSGSTNTMSSAGASESAKSAGSGQSASG